MNDFLEKIIKDKKRKGETLGSVPKPGRINGRALCFGGGQGRAHRMRPAILLMPQLSLPYLITSLARMNKKTPYNKYYTEQTKRESQENRKFFEEIARQTNCENSCSQIKYCFGNKCSSRFIYHINYFKFTMKPEICQENRMA